MAANTNKAVTESRRFMARRVALGWLVALGVIAAVALVVANRSNDPTIKYWTETVDQRIEVCNPTNADLATAPLSGPGVVDLNTGGNICIRNRDGRYAHTPYLNRLDRDTLNAPDLFKPPGRWVLTLARIDSDTPSVIRAVPRRSLENHDDACRVIHQLSGSDHAVLGRHSCTNGGARRQPARADGRSSLFRSLSGNPLYVVTVVLSAATITARARRRSPRCSHGARA